MKKKWLIAGGLTALAASTAFGQESRGEFFFQAVPAPAGAGNVMYKHNAETVAFLSTEMSFEGSVVKGAPYSADATTETTQVLNDGNRISRKTTASLYRDGDGRTRREQSLPAFGPLAGSTNLPVNTFINDPAAGVNYVLESVSKTARKIPAGNLGENANKAVYRKMIQSSVLQPASAPDTKEETLPSQMMEGVQAQGTRTTVTIPAGQVGNERPIEIISERWYSPELKLVVMTKHSDPRMGETVYKLTRLQRTEPSHSLFEVPADYTVKNDSLAEMDAQKKMMMELQHKKMVEANKE